MRSKKKYIALAIVAVIIAIAIYAYKEYNRKAKDINSIAAAVNTTAAMLTKEYAADENLANKKYLGKIILVNGTINEIQNLQDTAITILLGDSLQTSKVSCTISNNNLAATKNYKLGQIVSIKGICTGYLMDVELNNCVVEK